MRILEISSAYLPDIGGINTHMADLCKYLSNVKKDKVYLLTFKPYSRKLPWVRNEKINAYFQVRRYWWLVGHFFDVIERYPLLSFLNIASGMAIYSLFYAARYSQKIDVVHAHGLNAAFAGKLVKALFHKRLVVSIHAIYGLDKKPLLGKLVQWVLKDADKVLILSEAAKLEYNNLNLDQTKIGRFTYWVDQNKFKKIDQKSCRKKLNLGDKFTVIFVGRFIPIKGIDIILQLAKCFPGIQFVMVGGGLLESYVRQEAVKNKNIFLFENIDNNEMPFFYNAADLLLIPSLYEEGYGRVIIEALSCGLPVVGSRMGGIKEAVSSEVGILVKPSLAEFRKALSKLLNNKNSYDQMKRRALPYAKNKFSYKNAEKIRGTLV